MTEYDRKIVGRYAQYDGGVELLKQKCLFL